MSQFIGARPVGTSFIVKNTSKLNRALKFWGFKLNPGQQYNLLNLPAISEDDIRASLLKGDLHDKLLWGEIQIVSCDINLSQFNNDQKIFLESHGIITSSSVAATPTSSLKVMLVGDSQTVGNGGTGDDAAAYREGMWSALRNMRGQITLLGNSVVGPSGRNSLLSDWRMAATGGQTIAQADAQATASEALAGPADVYVVLAGTNDTSLGRTVAQMQTDLSTLIAHRRAANANAQILILSLCPWVNPAANFAANNAVRNSYNAAFPALCTSLGVKYVEAGTLLGPGQMNNTGNHPSGDGFRIIGRAVAEAIVKYCGVVGPTWPRNVIRRAARNVLNISAETGQVMSIATSSGMTPTGGASFSLGMYFRPSDLSPAYERRIYSASPGGGVRNIWINCVGAAGVIPNGVQAFVGDSVSPLVSASQVFVLNKWTVIVLSANANTKLVQLWVMREGADGRAVTTLAGAAYAPSLWNLSNTISIFGQDGSSNGQPGLYGDFWVANGTAVTADDAEAFYYDSTIPPGVTAYYPFNEGSGASANPSSGFNTLPIGSDVGAGWSAAGAVATPWNFNGDS